MPNFLSKEYLPHYLLSFILLLAFFLRVWGLDYGLPYFLVGDERSMVYGALKMGELKTLIPAFHPEEFRILYYPPLMSYFYLFFLAPLILIQYFIGSFTSFTELANYFILNPAPLWLISRLINALMGVATVYLIYLIGKKVFNHWVGLISALFLTLSFLHIQLSHFTRQWVPILFFSCLIMLLSFYVYKFPRRKYYLWTGLVSGLGFGVGYPAAIFLVIFLLAHFLSNKFSFWGKMKDRNLWLALGIFLLLASFFIFLHPHALINLVTGAGNGGSSIISSLTASKDFSGYLNAFIFYFKVILFYEPVILILSLMGVIFLWFKSKKTLLVFLFWPFFYISFLYFFAWSLPRFALLIFPWLILLAAYALYLLITKFSEKVRKLSLIKMVALILVFIYPLTVAIQYDYLLSQKDTRILAKNWIEKNIPARTKIISKGEGVNPVPNKEAILFQKELDANSLRVADQVLLSLNDKDYPKPAYNVLKLGYINRERMPSDLNQFIQNQNYQYFLIAFWDEDDLSEEEKMILQKAQLIQEFKPDQTKKAEDINGNFLRPIFLLFTIERLGPIVRIYKLL